MISIIIPSYNNSEILKQSLITWKNQLLSNNLYEVIVVDNNSVDNTQNVVQKAMEYMPNLRYVLETTPGATAARHCGAHLAQGEYLIFADNDGLFNPKCLQSILKMYEQNPELSVVACRISLKWDDIEPSWIAPYRFMYGELDYGTKPSISADYFFNGGLFSIKKSLFESVGGFNPDLIGDYLIGDGDTGLVNKIHATKIPIGWCPDAVMEHMQSVKTHGSKKGLGRHFFNTGVSRSYALYRECGFKMNFKVIQYFFKQSILLIYKSIQYVIVRDNYQYYFSLRQRQGETKFFSYLLNPSLRKEIRTINCYDIS